MVETARARQAWADYVAMGPGRSLRSLAAHYRSVDEAPTRRFETLAAWSQRFCWQARLKDIADREAKAAEEREAAYRRSIMEAGYALSHERVAALKRLAEKLFDELQDPEKLWLRDYKGGGKAGFREIQRFNAAEVEQLRGLLDDIAKEKGDRREKVDLAASGSVAIQVIPWKPRGKTDDNSDD